MCSKLFISKSSNNKNPTCYNLRVQSVPDLKKPASRKRPRRAEADCSECTGLGKEKILLPLKQSIFGEH